MIIDLNRINEKSYFIEYDECQELRMTVRIYIWFIAKAMAQYNVTEQHNSFLCWITLY